VKSARILIAGKFLYATGMMFAFVVLAVGAAGGQNSSYNVIHSFSGVDGDGSFPVSDLVSDAAHNLYGTASAGGNYNGNCTYPEGCGTVFELSPTSGGGWTRTVIYKFNGDPDGSYPLAGLILDGAGNLYGTTSAGGVGATGTVFELSPAAGGGWTETVLYSFLDGADGGNPASKLVMDPSGNLYGTTSVGGAYGEGGTVFELTPTGGGNWTEQVLYSFDFYGTGGYDPLAGLVRDAAGNLYGTAFLGANESKPCLDGQYQGCGVVFELSPNSSGGWSYNVILTFDAFNGGLPRSNLIMDSAGNLYGATSSGGNVKFYGYGGFGVVFELSPNSSGGWTETVLHVFGADATVGSTFLDGVRPYSDVAMDSAGNLYGTTLYGGTGYGDVYKLSPATTGAWKIKVLFSFSNIIENGSRLGLYPEGGVLVDAAGNVYGTTLEGGAINGDGGVVFKITQ